jgi:hypothetical protein
MSGRQWDFLKSIIGNVKWILSCFGVQIMGKQRVTVEPLYYTDR